MKNSRMMKKLAAFLKERRAQITKKVTVCTPRYDPTYGRQEPGEETIEVVDLDALLKAMDEFGDELRERELAKKSKEGLCS